MGTTAVLTLVATVAGLAGAAGALLRGRRPSGGSLRDLVIGAYAAGGVGFLGLVVLFSRLDIFGLIHLVYLGLVITLPMLGLAALGLRRPVVGLVLFLPAAVGGYMTHIAPFELRTERASLQVASARAGEDDVLIAVLADLQATKVSGHEIGAINRIMRAKPDLILIAGDLFQGTNHDWVESGGEVRAQLARLHAPGGVFFVEGDTDGAGAIEGLIGGLDITYLDNDIATTRVGDRRVRIAGVELDYNSADAKAVYAELKADQDPGVLTILLSHRPDSVLLADPESIDLVVAGHTHGGQVVIPGFGPPMTLSHVPRAVARGGLHEVDGTPIFVSNGVGIERNQAPQMRLFSTPSIGLIRLSG